MTESHSEPAADGFAEFARLHDEAMRLDRGAALIGSEDSGADVDQCLQQLDAIATKARSRVEQCGDSMSRLRALVDYLSEDYGLRGNTEDYYDPRNSLIEVVLERRLGIPISLSVIYIEVARRLGVPLRGVSFPAHFLIKHCADPEVFIDPFEPKRFLDEDDCAKLLLRLSNGKVELHPDHLRTATTRQILIRMLVNLKIVYAKDKKFEKAVRASSRILLLAPNNADEFRDRGMLYWQFETFRLAKADLREYLKRRPEAPDRFEVEQTLQSVEERLDMLH